MTSSIVAFDMSVARAILDSVEEFPVDFDAAWQWLGYSTWTKLRASVFQAEGENE